MKALRFAAAFGLGMALAVATPAYPEALEHDHGAGNFLNGFWTLGGAGTTGIFLLNPTGRARDAVALFYDGEERFLTCAVRRLSPHDLEPVVFPVPFRDFCATFPDTCGGRIAGAVTGHVEVRSEPVDGTGKPGLNGYLLVGARGTTVMAAPPLFVLDPGLFEIEPKDAPRIAQCACPELKTLRSPLEGLFCGP